MFIIWNGIPLQMLFNFGSQTDIRQVKQPLARVMDTLYELKCANLSQLKRLCVCWNINSFSYCNLVSRGKRHS